VLATSVIKILLNPTGFDDWVTVHELLRRTYAFMDARIDPPSSVHQLGVDGLQKKAQHEEVVLAQESGVLVGCAFGRPQSDSLYIGKIAVSDDARGQGVARKMLERLEACARERGLSTLELEARIELVENHEVFRRLGFSKTQETSHPGYDRVTGITMIKNIEVS